MKFERAWAGYYKAQSILGWDYKINRTAGKWVTRVYTDHSVDCIGEDRTLKEAKARAYRYAARHAL